MRSSYTHFQKLSRFAIALIAASGSILLCNPGVGHAGTSPSYPNVVFSDGFESGNLTAWDGTGGSPGTVTVSAAAARSGTYGARLTNAAGQYAAIVKALPRPLPDSSVSFWARVSPGGGLQTLAQGRDQTSALAWWLVYDGTHQGLYFYPYSGSGSSTEIFTGANSIPTDTWVKIEVQYTATPTGGAQLFVNGQTNPAWGVSGDYTRTNNLQQVQLWNDSASTTDFDDVSVATPPLTAPDAPTGATGTPHDGAIALNWTAPAWDGGAAITGYRVTTYLSGVAHAPILTKSTSTSYTVKGLSNGTPYTFTVAAINSVGTGPDSIASAPVAPAPNTTPGAPTGVQATPSDGAATVSWTAPTADGGTPIIGYQITPYLNGTAQTPYRTTTDRTSQYVGDNLANGGSYAFTVAAINAVGAGSASSPSAPVTPAASPTPYTHAVFADGFESGNLSAWSGNAGSTGTVAVVHPAAHLGAWGARLTNPTGQFAVLVAALSQPVLDGSVSFWARVSPGGSTQVLAEARDQNSSSQVAWVLLYDANRQGLYLDAYNGSGASTELFTGSGVMPTNTWVKIEVQYTATSNGGARLYVDGQTQAAWAVTGDYTRTNNIQRIQLWNDSASTTDFDNVRVAAPGPVMTPPAAPTGVQGAPQDGAIALTWTAPSSDGGSPITGYRVTPYLNGVPQAAVLTKSTSPSYTVKGLSNGTAYTFTVAAINAVGPGPESAASVSLSPVAATTPGAPTAVQATASDGSATVSWTAPASDGGSQITKYRITPYMNGTAQTPITTTSSATSQVVTGLTSGASYTFTVTALNAAGAGPESTPSAPVTP